MYTLFGCIWETDVNWTIALCFRMNVKKLLIGTILCLLPCVPQYINHCTLVTCCICYNLELNFFVLSVIVFCMSLWSTNTYLALQLAGDASWDMGICECWCIWTCYHRKLFLSIHCDKLTLPSPFFVVFYFSDCLLNTTILGSRS